MIPYTLLLLNLDRTATLVMHVRGENLRAAYEGLLKALYDDAGLDPDQDPFNIAEAKRDRPLVAAFEGHQRNLVP